MALGWEQEGLGCKDTMETVGRYIVVMGLVCSPVGKSAGVRAWVHPQHPHQDLGFSPVPAAPGQ